MNKFWEDNKEMVIRATWRFIRVAVATVASLFIMTIVNLLTQAKIDPAWQGIIVLVLVPTLTSLDKLVRDWRTRDEN